MIKCKMEHEHIICSTAHSHFAERGNFNYQLYGRVGLFAFNPRNKKKEKPNLKGPLVRPKINITWQTPVLKKWWLQVKIRNLRTQGTTRNREKQADKLSKFPSLLLKMLYSSIIDRKAVRHLSAISPTLRGPSEVTTYQYFWKAVIDPNRTSPKSPNNSLRCGSESLLYPGEHLWRLLKRLK